MTGMMRVYFEILNIPVQPLDRMFQMPRYWMWFARITSQRMLLETVAAAHIRLLNFLFFFSGGFVHVAALDVFGLEAKSVWGQQWIKMLALLYEGVTVGLGGGILIGG
jgi:nucleoporin GLE1